MKISNSTNPLWRRTSRWRYAGLFAAALAMGTTMDAQVLFTETFTAGVSNAGFTQVDNGGTTCLWVLGNPGARTITGPMDADFAIADSDICGNPAVVNSSLVSPLFDASGGGTYELTFDHSFQDLGTTVAVVEAWNGVAWNVVFDYVGNSGFPNPSIGQSFDITAATGGSAAAQVRFRFNDNGEWNWWWAVDNVSVTHILCSAPTATAGPPTFNCGAGTYTVTVDVTALGNATDVDITSTANGGVIPGGDDVGIGMYTTPAIPFGTPTTITVVHNGDPVCNLNLGSFNFLATDCPILTYPYLQNFDAMALGSTSSTCTTPSVLTEGWSNVASSTWRVEEGGGNSGGTGPSVDHTSGTATGNYLYIETSTLCPDRIAQSPIFDLTANAAGSEFSVWYHMFGTTIGSFYVQIEDISNSPGTFTTVFGPLNGDQGGNVWNFSNWIDVSSYGPLVRFRVVGTNAATFTGDIAFDDFGVREAPACQAVSGVTVNNETTDGADVSWTCNTCSGDFVVEYGAPGFTPGLGIAAGAGGTVFTGTAVPGSPVTLTGLSSLTEYAVVVRERCGPGLFGENSAPEIFSTLCGGTTCNYLVRMGDIYGDGWDLSEWQVKQNGVVIATLGPQVVGCGDGGTGYVDVPISICDGATVTLEWTTLGSFTNEKALQFYNPFGLLLYDHRGTASYPGNCDDVDWTSANSAGTLGVKFTTTANCTPPSCNATAVPTNEDCLAGTYDILITDVDLTGNGTIQYSLNGVAQADIPFVSPVTISGIDVSQAAYITIVTDDGCTNEIGNVQSACAVELDCNAASPLPFAHCYSNGDTRTWYFHTPEVGGKIDLKFLAGSTLGAGDNVIFWNGVPGASAQIGSYSGDMSLQTFTGQTNQYLGVSITTNGSGSCDDGLEGTAWNFTVRCSGCTEPTGLVLVSPDDGSSVDCIAGTFGASVYVGSFGLDGTGPNAGFAPATTTISWTAGGVAQPDIVLTQTSDEAGLLTDLGVWPLETELDVTLLHGNGETVCNNQIGTDVTIPWSACPPDNDDCANAEVLPLNDDGDCPANSITGTTLGADQTGAAPTCASTAAVQDVWYTFNSGSSSNFTMNLTAATAGNIGVELFSACGVATAGCLADILPANNPITVTVTPATDYWLRIFTNVDTGTPGTFNLCVSAFDPCADIVAFTSCDEPQQVAGPIGVGSWTGYGSPFGTPGKEEIFTFTPTVSGVHRLEITAITGGYVDFFFKESSTGCNSTGWTYLDDVINPQSGPTLTMTAGTEYYIMWDPEGQTTVHDVTFSVTCAVPAPANDDCAGAISLDASSLTCTTVEGHTGGTTQSFAGCSGTANDDVWYSFLATETSHVVRVNGIGAFNPVFELLDGGVEPGVCPVAGPGITCQNATGAGGLETFTAVGLSIGNRYFVRVYDSGTGVFFSDDPSFNICVTRVPTCLAPTATAASAITTGSANANWTPNVGGSGTNFIVEYGPSATFTSPGSGLTAGPNGTVILGATTPQLLSGLSDNTQYRYFVRQNCTSTSEGFSFNSNGITFTTLALPPANDECAGAISLSGTNTTCINTLGTIAGSTRSLPAPDCSGTADDDVWYSFVAAGAGNYTINVNGTPGFLDGAHQLFSGTCGALTQVACSDPAAMTVQGLTAGETYYVRVYSWSSVQPANKTFNICVVKNSDCLPPTTITTSNITSSSADVTVAGSLTADYVLEYGLQSNWSAAGAGVDGSPGTNGTVITFTGNLQQISGLLAQTAYSYVVRRDCGTGVYSANSTARFFTTLGPPPVNDQCADAIAITCGNTYTGTNVNATAEGLPSQAAGGEATISNGVWWKYVGDDQTVTLALCASNFDTRIHVFSAPTAAPTPCSNLTGIAGNDDDNVVCLSTRSRVTFGAAVGTTYYIAVEGYFTASGNISMVATCGPYCAPPANDQCANAQSVIPSAAGFCDPVAGTTACALPTAGANPTCSPSTFQSYQDVYYTFTAAGSTHPMQVNALSGTLAFWALNEATCGGQQDFCSNTFNSLVNVTGLTPGAVYKIRIGSVADADFDICIGAPTCEQDLAVEWQLGATGAIPAWEMRQVGTNLVVASGGGFNPGVPFAVYPEVTCLPAGNFYFALLSPLDAGGGYKVRLSQAPFTRFIDNTQSVGSGSINEVSGVPAVLGSNGPLQIPIGSNDLLYSSCDKYFWATGEYLVANEDPQVAATWLVGQGDAAQSSTSGYDFWFYNPDGGYSFIRQRRNNVSDNFAAIGSARTCHMKVNNWAAGNHIPNLVELNVRVRGVVNNVPKKWGPACRFTRNEALANCTPTKLFDIPGHFAYSCGVTRAFNTATANRLYARPVAGATKYRFHIFNGETDITLERTVYYLTLGWNASVAPPLGDEQVYDVTVEAFVGGQYCPVGDVCTVTICNTPSSCVGPVAGGQQNSVLDTDGSFLMWPNPNNGAQLNVTLSGVAEGMNTVSMDIFDLSGKRIITRTLGVQDGFVNQVVDLNGEISTGMYMVKVIAGEQVYSERLVIQK